MSGFERTPIAIDPKGCGCTECCTGEYIPLDRATPEQIMLMINGKIRNNTGEAWAVQPRIISEYGTVFDLDPVQVLTRD